MPTFSAPSWLNEMQSAALRLGAAEGLPTQSDESWHYTPIQKFLKKEFTQIETNQSEFAVPQEVLNLFSKADYALYFYNGEFLVTASKSNLKEGVQVAQLSRALMGAGRVQEIAKNLLSRNSNPNLKSIGRQNQGSYKEGAFVQIKANAEGAKNKIAVVHLYGNLQNATEQKPFSVCPRNIFSFDADSRAEIVEAHIAVNEISFQINSAADYVLEKGAKVNAAQFIWVGSEAIIFNDTDVQLREEAELHFLNLTRGAALARNELNCRLLQPRASANVYSLSVAGHSDHIDNSSFIQHVSGETRSVQVARSLLSDKSKVVFSGRLKIDKEAQKSDAKQTTHNLLLSDDAEVDAKPQLEVLADDVKAAHGATVGQLREIELFYLMSRGIKKEEAIKMLADGFQIGLIEQMPQGFVREVLLRALSGEQS